LTAITWKSGVNGDWSDAADWSTGTVPGAGDDVTIAASGKFTVTIDSAEAVHSLTFGGAVTEDATSTLSIASGDTLTLTGSSSFAGAIGGAGTLALTGTAAMTIAGAVSESAALSLAAGTSLTIGAGDSLSLSGTGLDPGGDDQGDRGAGNWRAATPGRRSASAPTAMAAPT
jgi:hypothetical protein